jgi:hypothetical protein
VLAVIRGSALNHNGAGNGMTAPHGPSQSQVMRLALADAGLGPADVDVVEGHGTGTPLGDAVEAEAVIDAYGRHRPADRPVWLGSVKANIGHPHAASGVVGVIKTILSMRHGIVPEALHTAEPLAEVDWEGGGVATARRAVAWPEAGRPRRAGVSSFGGNGTKVHVVLEQAPDTPEAPLPTSSPDAERPRRTVCCRPVRAPPSPRTPKGCATGSPPTTRSPRPRSPGRWPPAPPSRNAPSSWRRADISAAPVVTARVTRRRPASSPRGLEGGGRFGSEGGPTAAFGPCLEHLSGLWIDRGVNVARGAGTATCSHRGRAREPSDVHRAACSRSHDRLGHRPRRHRTATRPVQLVQAASPGGAPAPRAVNCSDQHGS